jgi:hypothetical protein
MKSTARRVIDVYLQFVRKNKRIPTNFDLKNGGVSRFLVSSNFGNLGNLTRALKKSYPKLFQSVQKASSQSDEVVNSIMRLINEK